MRRKRREKARWPPLPSTFINHSMKMKGNKKGMINLDVLSIGQTRKQNVKDLDMSTDVT